jgi:hypothetical protein
MICGLWLICPLVPLSGCPQSNFDAVKAEMFSALAISSGLTAEAVRAQLQKNNSQKAQ